MLLGEPRHCFRSFKANCGAGVLSCWECVKHVFALQHEFRQCFQSFVADLQQARCRCRQVGRRVSRVVPCLAFHVVLCPRPFSRRRRRRRVGGRAGTHGWGSLLFGFDNGERMSVCLSSLVDGWRAPACLSLAQNFLTGKKKILILLCKCSLPKKIATRLIIISGIVDGEINFP